MKKNSDAAGIAFTEKEEFQVLVKSNMKRAYFTAFGLLGSHDEAMDASQEAFIRAYRSFKKFDRSKNFFTWYYKILRNLCLNVLRSKKRKRTERIFEYKNTAVSENGIYEFVERDELNLKLEKAMFELDDESREILILREFNEQSYKQISEALEIPIGTVMSKLYYARKKLYSILKRDIE